MHRTGQDIFAALFLHKPTQGKGSEAIATLLESPYPTHQFCDAAQGLSRYSICAGPPRWGDDRPRLWTPPVGQGLDWLKSLHQLHRSGLAVENQGLPSDSTLPFQGGWLGWLGYDLAWEIEQLPTRTADPLPFPVVYWYEPEQFAVLDHQEQQLWLASTQAEDLPMLEHRLAMAPPQPTAAEVAKCPVNLTAALASDRLRFHSSQAEYMGAVRRAKNHIRAGDIFQANLSLRFSTAAPSESWPLYRTLQAINPSPFASYWRSPWGDVVSCSPERLLSLVPALGTTPGPPAPWTVSSRPIAGTRPRGQTLAEDQTLAQELCTDPKERAEHAMLVDLERNDLGRVCAWGSVAVDEFFTVERYSHVMHLVSNVVGALADDCDGVDAIRALFPGGTITGCPKVRCMEIIEALEPVRRSLFYGSFGYLDYRGQLDLNIAIRTLLMPVDPAGERSQIVGQVGAGIVADSDPEREWHESLSKAAAQLSAIWSQSPPIS